MYTRMHIQRVRVSSAHSGGSAHCQLRVHTSLCGRQQWRACSACKFRHPAWSAAVVRCTDIVSTGRWHMAAATKSLCAGASQLLQGMAFKGSQTRTHFATIRQVLDCYTTNGTNAALQF